MRLIVLATRLVHLRFLSLRSVSRNYIRSGCSRFKALCCNSIDMLGDKFAGLRVHASTGNCKGIAMSVQADVAVGLRAFVVQSLTLSRASVNYVRIVPR